MRRHLSRRSNSGNLYRHGALNSSGAGQAHTLSFFLDMDTLKTSFNHCRLAYSLMFLSQLCLLHVNINLSTIGTKASLDFSRSRDTFSSRTHSLLDQNSPGHDRCCCRTTEFVDLLSGRDNCCPKTWSSCPETTFFSKSKRQLQV